MDTQLPNRHQKYQTLIARARQVRAVPTAVVHPCDDVSLSGAVEAARLGLTEPILVGPPQRIRDTAQT
jgi:phosphate acetyltransferase